MQARMSPGGSMLNSLRNRPLEPPSSLTVTTAQRSEISGFGGLREVRSTEGPTYCFRPFKSVDKPVPPPIATTRKPRLVADERLSGASLSEEKPIGATNDPRLCLPEMPLPPQGLDIAIL